MQAKFFKKFDKNKDGGLSFNEFFLFISRGGGSAEEARDTFEKIDSSKDENITLEEFKNLSSIPHIQDEETS
jgi:Ca2+-binding EF-hand superfamily protein